MGEKRGETVKLEYDFNTAGVLEVFLHNKNWYRVTSKDFRSFDGQRRITEPEKPQGLGEIFNVPMITYSYEGPVYLWGTNKQVRFSGSGKVIESNISKKFAQNSGSRG